MTELIDRDEAVRAIQAERRHTGDCRGDDNSGLRFCDACQDVDDCLKALASLPVVKPVVAHEFRGTSKSVSCEVCKLIYSASVHHQPVVADAQADTIMELQADVTTLSYHLRRALDVLKGDVPIDTHQIAEAERSLSNVTTYELD